ncbi:aspartic proteinase CDR1-like [Tripterygium wilfordii]|uniref:aspartic proteinase CDR1-like n=1 Tax=Tripterygium wilfordii TaxID=458696 RepID=UPI0018F82C03|nr:aspartic proteinase CDR1-like [Tripterygium wilfordii]
MTRTVTIGTIEHHQDLLQYDMNPTLLFMVTIEVDNCRKSSWNSRLGYVGQLRQTDEGLKGVDVDLQYEVTKHLNTIPPSTLPFLSFPFASTMDALSYLFIFFLFNSLPLSTIEAKRNSFSVDLIHRDSTLSPLYNNSSTSSENVVTHSINDVNHFNSSMYIDAKYVQSDLTHTSSEYLMTLHISKSYEVVAIASMTSDLIWIQCAPCHDCYEQDKPFFQPGESTKPVPYESHFCKALDHIERGEENGECLYAYKSGDQKFTSGVLDTETFYLKTHGTNRRQPYEEIVFGCGTRNKMRVPRQVQGVVGLGRGELSLVSQLGKKISGKFSYCLQMDHMNTISKLKFGPQPVINDLTSIFKLFPQPRSTSSLYVLELKSISIKGQKFKVSDPHRDMIIDIGATMTSLHESIYNNLVTSVQQAIGDNIKPVKDSTGRYSLCYKRADLSSVEIPDMIFSFARGNLVSGKSLTLRRHHTFVKYGEQICMMIIKSTHPSGSSVLGSAAQKNFRVEYEAGKNQVTFIETDCQAASIS